MKSGSATTSIADVSLLPCWSGLAMVATEAEDCENAPSRATGGGIHGL